MKWILSFCLFLVANTLIRAQTTGTATTEYEDGSRSRTHFEIDTHAPRKTLADYAAEGFKLGYESTARRSTVNFTNTDGPTWRQLYREECASYDALRTDYDSLWALAQTGSKYLNDYSNVFVAMRGTIDRWEQWKSYYAWHQAACLSLIKEAAADAANPHYTKATRDSAFAAINYLTTYLLTINQVHPHPADSIYCQQAIAPLKETPRLPYPKVLKR